MANVMASAMASAMANAWQQSMAHTTPHKYICGYPSFIRFGSRGEVSDA